MFVASRGVAILPAREFVAEGADTGYLLRVAIVQQVIGDATHWGNARL